MPQLSNEDDRNLRDSLRRFLNLQSKTQTGTQLCGYCGSVCTDLPTNVWIEGDEEAFTIWLPFCPDCNPELFARIPTVN